MNEYIHEEHNEVNKYIVTKNNKYFITKVSYPCGKPINLQYPSEKPTQNLLYPSRSSFTMKKDN